MILRVCYANTQRWYDDYIELECQGMPSIGTSFKLNSKQSLKLEEKILATKQIFETYSFLVEDDDFKPIPNASFTFLNLDNHTIIYDIDWYMKESDNEMMCYIHLADSAEKESASFWIKKDIVKSDEVYRELVETHEDLKQ